MDYHKYYLGQLYPLQDKFLRLLERQHAGQFYLTGGTALSRFYFQHRYSDDLDFFSRYEVKDIADIWVMAKNLSFSWRDMMDIAEKNRRSIPLKYQKLSKCSLRTN